MWKCFAFFVATWICGAANAQPVLRLRGWKPDAGAFNQPLTRRSPASSHLLIQFAHPPSAGELRALADRGAKVLSYVPDFAYLISAPDRASFDGLHLARVHRLQPQEKISAELDSGRGRLSADLHAVIEFFPDVDAADSRAIANSAGLRIHENPDVLPNHLLVSGTRVQFLDLAAWDEVAYVFPASPDLVRGTAVHACAGAMTSAGAVSQAIPLIGDGWDGPGLGSASINYVFADATTHLPEDSEQSEIKRALAQWAQNAQITFTQASDPSESQTLSILFATGAHGDGYPFVGSTVLAHTFYPYPINPEPIAGDMHFNDAQNWQIGAGVDLYSVALHEIGHALGLGHSDRPGDVMYPYYRMHSVLMPNDIAALQELYAAPSAAAAPNPSPSPQPDPAPVSPLAIAIVAPPATTSASAISLSGSASGGSGTVQVTWSNGASSGAAQGSANWFVPAVPLIAGTNVITVTARDSLSDQVTSSVTVNYQPAAPPSQPNPPPPPSPPPPNPNPPSGSDSTPPSLTILTPATNNYVTSASALTVSGTATDNVAVASVTWATSNGTSGTATGTSNWSTPPIALYVGATTIVITAADSSGNTSWRSITVTRN